MATHPGIHMRAWLSLIRETFKEYFADEAPRLGAALAFYTIFSLPALLILVIAVAGLAFGVDAAQGQIVNEVQAFIGEESAKTLQTVIESARRPEAGIVATIVGLVTLLLGATGVFGELEDALNIVWNVPKKEGFSVLALVKSRFLSFTLILGTGFLLLVSLVVSAGIAALGKYSSQLFPDTELLLQIASTLISLAVITVLFAMIYKILPKVKVAWKDVWIGAFLATLLFTLGKSLIALYIGKSGVASTYGAAGSLVVILIWVYFSAQVFLLGAEFTQVYSRHHGSRKDNPAKPASA